MTGTFIRHVLVMALWLAAVGVAPVHAGLVAPVYPGAAPAPQEVYVQNQPYERLFFTRDPISRVLAFYRDQLGEMQVGQDSRTESYHHITGKGPIREKESIEPYNLGVFISAPRLKEGHEKALPISQGTPGYSPQLEGADQRCFFNDFFTPLRNMVGLLEHRDWQQYNEICERYYHLTWSMFLMTDERDRRDRPMRMDQVLVRNYWSGADTPPSGASDLDPAQMAAKMQALAMAGRRDEARALAEQLASAQSQRGSQAPGVRMKKGKIVDDWDDWVALLAEIDQHAYRTKILIHTKPATWPRRK